MGKLIDLTGKVFERLTVRSRGPDYISPSGNHVPQWWCECSCGKEDLVLVIGSSLKSGYTKSCGCLMKERVSEVNSKTNYFDLETEDYAIGYTLKGEPFWIDKEDVDLISKYCWYYDDKGYLSARDKENQSHIKLHRLIMGFPNPELYEVDHKNHPPRNEHKIDNRKMNLAIVNRSQNQMNISIQTNNTSGVTGVDYHKASNKWRARICVNRKSIDLGLFDDFDRAVDARKEAEIKYFGEYRYDAHNTQQNDLKEVM